MKIHLLAQKQAYKANMHTHTTITDGRLSPEEIKANLVSQLTAPVRWTPTITNMINDGGKEFTECGPGNVQQGLISKIKKAIGAE